jgi:hypothetical protein
MVPRRAQDQACFLTERPRAEEEDHDEGVGEAHFRAVDGAVARCFEEREDVVVGWVFDDGFERGLWGVLVRLVGRGRGAYAHVGYCGRHGVDVMRWCAVEES